MVAVTIVTQSLEDLANGKPLMEGIVPEHCDRWTIGILEAGMVSGATSLMFILNQGEKTLCAEMSANQFEMLVGAVRGAVQRFGK